MTLKINYSKKTDKFLKKNQSVITQKEVRELVILSIRKEERILLLRKEKGEWVVYYNVLLSL